MWLCLRIFQTWQGILILREENHSTQLRKISFVQAHWVYSTTEPLLSHNWHMFMENVLIQSHQQSYSLARLSSALPAGQWSFPRWGWRCPTSGSRPPWDPSRLMRKSTALAPWRFPTPLTQAGTNPVHACEEHVCGKDLKRQPADGPRRRLQRLNYEGGKPCGG